MKTKILFFALLLVSFIGCDDLTDEVVNSPNSEYNVSNITAPDNVVFQETDSSLVATIKIDNTDVISQVWYNVITPNASETIINNVAMFDDGNKANYGDEEAGDGIYSGKTYLGISKPSGKYLLQFYVKDNVNNEDDNIRVVGFHQLEFDNGQNKIAPVISDLVIPDSVDEAEVFIFTLKVEDKNGLEDIDEVYFELFRPDGTSLGKIFMLDNGNQANGDEAASDGIYSFKNSFEPSAERDLQKGNWKFVFQAKDRSGLLSNKINHTMYVKNSPPIISNLSMPDSISRGVEFTFTVDVYDANGIGDISEVSFKFVRPDNTSSGTILMVDNGDINLGDETAGDGIYSFKNSFSDGSTSEAAQLGEWTFVFRTEDKGGLLSNEISHIILVKE